MIIGPLTGGMLRFFDHIFSRKVKTGYEMLFRNFSAGLIGGLLFLCNFLYLALCSISLVNKVII